MRLFDLYMKGSSDVLGTVTEEGEIIEENILSFSLLVDQIRRGKNKGEKLVIMERQKTRNGLLSGSGKLKLTADQLSKILNNKQSKSRRSFKPLVNSDKDLIRDLNDRGFSLTNIAFKINRSKSVVHRVLN